LTRREETNKVILYKPVTVNNETKMLCCMTDMYMVTVSMILATSWRGNNRVIMYVVAKYYAVAMLPRTGFDAVALGRLDSGDTGRYSR